ncbi:GH25 family lysozyme [Peribacillus loiseleuriae]|uniref:GH25 family lysozyme n=1 Tax=Peribacillus loiseleuriae TaxID=1679170 RepID=UPI00069D915F|nr:GH25 family lysozyme [Peribacillus loiseleuriae]
MEKNQIVDISHYQPSNKINWEKAAKEVAFMIIRVQYGSRSMDSEYKNHVANCKKYGIPFGHYAYARFVSETDAKVEANDFLNRIDKEAKFLVVDVEEKTTSTAAQMVPATQAFIDVCKEAGWKTGLYTGHHFYQPYSMDQVKTDFLWLPRYGTNNGLKQTQPDYPCDIWQYTSVGRVSWYEGDLDLNVLNGNKSLEWFIDIDQKEGVKVVANIDDITGHWAEKSLGKAKKAGIMIGYEDGSMRPNEPVTRAQLAVILDRLKLLDK